MNIHETINYLEYPAKNLTATKEFFMNVFKWSFTDYGSEYVAFSNLALKGGFYKSAMCANSEKGSALTVFYSNNLTATQAKIEKFGGEIIKPIFSFPGGHRFHFCGPSGNEFAVWSDNYCATV